MEPIFISCGDPAGIGPEVAYKATLALKDQLKRPLVFVGVSKSFSDCPDLQYLKEGYQSHILQLHEIEGRCPSFKMGQPSEESGAIALATLEQSLKLCRQYPHSALVTAPVSKEAIEMTGYSFTGHTEWLADALQPHESMMLMSSSKIHVAYATTHCALDEVTQRIDERRIHYCLELLHDYFLLMNHREAKIAVCGLNPHAGENGLFGKEEQLKIIPAIERAKQQGIDVHGPFPADTLFVESIRKPYDLILSMYHDQGGIPFKMLSFDEGVNLTLGLPISRTSVDHGTAWDLVGQNQASEKSMIEAILLADQWSKRRQYSSMSC